jgi:8-oxo-dGTP pyrophosphatase MutT (NUDIX family)
MQFRVVPVAIVFLRRDVGDTAEVLLQLRQGTGFMDGHWAAAAAGHVEAGESVLEAAVREATEELGITIDPADLVPHGFPS